MKIDKILFFAVIVILGGGYLSGQQMVPLREIMNPAKVVAGDKDLYIIQDTTIFIYGLKNFQLKGKFGKKGEGPGEFPVGRHFNVNLIHLTPISGRIAVSSRNKVMYFSEEGEFLQEKKMFSGMGSQIVPMGEFFVAQTFTGFREGERPSRAINLYDGDLGKIRELFKQPVDFAGMGMGRDPSKKINEFSSPFGLAIGNKKIYLFNSDSFNIQVINPEGSMDTPIEVDYSPVKITSSIKEGLWQYYKNVRFKGNWEQVKNRLEVPSYFPALQSLQVSDGKLYVQTFRQKEGKCEFFIFENIHTLEKTLMVPLARTNAREYYPFYIKNRKIYQLIESEDDESWVLHIHEI